MNYHADPPRFYWVAPVTSSEEVVLLCTSFGINKKKTFQENSKEELWSNPTKTNSSHKHTERKIYVVLWILQSNWKIICVSIPGLMLWYHDKTKCKIWEDKGKKSALIHFDSLLLSNTLHSTEYIDKQETNFLTLNIITTSTNKLVNMTK